MHNLRYDSEDESIERGIAKARPAAPITGLDRQGLHEMVSVIGDLASDIVTKGVTAEAFQQEVAAWLAGDLLPRMAGIHVLDGMARETTRAGNAHHGEILADLDAIIEKYRRMIRADDELVDLFDPAFLDRLGI